MTVKKAVLKLSPEQTKKPGSIGLSLLCCQGRLYYCEQSIEYA